MLQSKAWQRRVSSLWTGGGIDGRQIRRVEAMQPALLPDGRRLRGVMLAPELCLARDRKFYEVKDGVARELQCGVVLARYSTTTLKQLFQIAARATRAARQEQHK
jgi:hypothetical protein